MLVVAQAFARECERQAADLQEQLVDIIIFSSTLSLFFSSSLPFSIGRGPFRSTSIGRVLFSHSRRKINYDPPLLDLPVSAGEGWGLPDSSTPD